MTQMLSLSTCVRPAVLSPGGTSERPEQLHDFQLPALLAEILIQPLRVLLVCWESSSVTVTHRPG